MPHDGRAVFRLAEMQFDALCALERRAGFHIAVVDRRKQRDAVVTCSFFAEHLEETEVLAAARSVRDVLYATLQLVEDQNKMAVLDRGTKVVQIRWTVPAPVLAEPRANQQP